jgi:OmpA-OmpF porin, OOP family
MFQMKILSVCLFTAFGFLTVQSQSVLDRVGQKVKDKTNQRVANRTDRTIDKGLDKTEQALDSAFKKKSKKAGSSAEENTATSNSSSSAAGKTDAAQNTSKTKSAAPVKGNSDFVPGQTVIFSDDFSKDAMSDFPAKWNSNGSGNLTLLDGIPGRWLQLKMSTAITPELNKPLPENSTVEFDLYLDAQDGKSTPFIQFGLTTVKNILKEDMFYKDRFFMNIHRYAEENGKTVEYGLQNDVLGSKGDFNILSYTNKVLHVAMAINKTRIRIYLDDTKVVDLPKALTPDMRNNFFINSGYIIPAPELDMYVANIRIASAETDARSLVIKQLMEEGRAVTNDILFDVNSDVIKPSSYAIVNQFGETLKANPSLKIKIIGHTDSDGSAAANLELSKKRAAAVKKYLAGNYSVADARIQTDGKGAAQPVADNGSETGKAKNRRVEFVKL